jgi:flavin reductase (DIM6/NTAB) family NADH-FMN oxidoreductase RutF
MFYEPSKEKPLRFDPLKAIIAPRPIGWISTLNADGQPNLAPYSFFNIFSLHPPIVGFASGGVKDSIRNARRTGEFVHNFVAFPSLEAMVKTSGEFTEDVDEFVLAGVRAKPSRIVSPPRVADAPAALECKVVNIIELKDMNGQATDRHLALGQVVGVYIDDTFLKDELFDLTRARPVARCGYRDYSTLQSLIVAEGHAEPLA